MLSCPCPEKPGLTVFASPLDLTNVSITTNIRLVLNSLTETHELNSGLFYKELRLIIKKEELFKTWFSSTALQLDERQDLILFVPNAFTRNFIEKKFLSEISSLARQLWDKKITIQVKSPEPVREPLKSTNAKPVTLAELPMPKKVSNHYTFEDFIAGEENLLAFVAAKCTCEEQNYAFNSPLTITGAHGLGKTHLAMAIAKSHKPHETAYLHAEEFCNEYVHASREGKMEAIRGTLRSKKLFIIEDLDYFLEGNKKKTLEELINTIKVLKRDHKQIVITTTRPAADYEAVSPTLAHLMLSGLKVRLKEPSAASRMLHIQRFMAKYKLRLAPKSVELVESISFKSIRELDGALRQLIAFSIHEKDHLPLSVVKDVLADHIREHGARGSARNKDLHAVAKLVSKAFGISFAKIVSATRERHISEARHIAMSLSNEVQHFTLTEIGQFYGGRKHQSVIFALQKVVEKRKKDMEFNTLYDKLSQQLKSLAE